MVSKKHSIILIIVEMSHRFRSESFFVYKDILGRRPFVHQHFYKLRI